MTHSSNNLNGAVPSVGIALFPHYGPEEFASYAQLIDDQDIFSHLWIPDERFHRDIAVELTLAALNTKRVQIGSAVTDPFIRHPALTATMMATVDELANRRVVVGIGAGISGFDALGIARSKPTLSIREAVELMRALWRGSEVDIAGTTVKFHGRLDFSPVRSEIPVWVAGRGPSILSLAGEIADGVFIGGFASEPGLEYAHARIDAGLQKAGRTHKSITRALWLHTAVAEDGESAREAVRQIVAGILISSRSVIDAVGLPIPHELLQAVDDVTYGLNSPEMGRVAAMIDEPVLNHFAVAGTPDDVRTRMKELRTMGVEHLAIVPWLTEGQSLEEFVADFASSLAPGNSKGGSHS